LAAERERIGSWWLDQEFGCAFVDTDDQFFSSEIVDRAVSPEVTPMSFPFFVNGDAA